MRKSFPSKFLIAGLIGISVSFFGFSVWASPSTVVRVGITNEEGTLVWISGGTNVLIDGYFKWEQQARAGSYVLRVKKINSAINRASYSTETEYLNAACTKEFPSDEDSISAPPDPADPVLVWFLNLSIGSIDYADTYCWKVRSNLESEITFDDTPWWVFSTEQEPVVEPPPGDGGGGGGGGGGGDGEDGGGGGGGDGGPPPTLRNPISAENITELFNKIFSFLFGLAIFLVPVFVIYAAFLMLMGGGDPVKLAKGRMILLWTAIAFIIILLSRGLPVVLKNLL